MANQTPKKALFLAFFSLFVFTTAARSILEEIQAPIVKRNEASVSPLPSPPAVLKPNAEMEKSIRDICAKTDYPQDCVTEVTPFFHGQTDPLHVVRSAMEGTMDVIRKAIEEAKKEAERVQIISKGAAAVFNDVKESYEDALENFSIAMEALDAKDIGTLNTMLSAALTDFSDNDDRITKRAVKLSAFDAELERKTSNCLAISSMITAV